MSITHVTDHRPDARHNPLSPPAAFHLTSSLKRVIIHLIAARFPAFNMAKATNRQRATSPARRSAWLSPVLCGIRSQVD
jgi:hypothetical protein